MDVPVGWVTPSVGNAIRDAVVEWCAAYREMDRDVFENVVVTINEQNYGFSPAISIKCEMCESDVDKIELQRAFLKFSRDLNSRFGVNLDKLEISSDEMRVSFLAPNGVRIPPFERQ